jgi:hypothetical protein
VKKITLSLFLSIWILILSVPAFGALPQLGDLNNDGKVDVADAILAFKILSRADTAGQTVNLGNADFNFDEKIAMEEAIFVLQAVAGMREVGVPTQDKAGTVVLPDGFPLPTAGLKVCGKMGTVSVGDAGSFTLPLSGSDAGLVVLTDAAGTPLMLGYMGGAAGNTISAATTAVALLFQGLAGYTQPPSAWSQMRELIAATPQAQTLANAIAARLAVDPEALSKNDQAISDALVAAVDAIVAQRQTTSQNSSAAVVGSVKVTVSRSPLSADITHIKVDGANPRSGVYVEPAASGNGIIARNDYRRHALILVYRTGWEDTAGTVHHTLWEQVADGPFEPIASGAYLMATTAVGGVIPSLIDLAFGNVVYSPTSTNLIPLPMFPGVDPDAVAKTFYRVVAVGDGPEADPVLPGDLKGVAADVEGAQSVMRALEFFKEFFLPLMFAVIPADEVAAQNNLNKQYVSTVLDVLNAILQGVPDASGYYAVGQYKNLIASVAKTLVSNPQFLNRVGTLIAKLGLIKGWNAATNGAVSGVAKKALVLLSIADKVVTAFDATVLVTHLANSQAYVEWDATAVWPPVRVQPKPATVEAGKNVQLIVTIGGETGDTDDYFYKFTWTTPGAHGKIVNPAGPAAAGTQVIMTSRSPGARINYESDPVAEPGDEDKVQVVVYRIGTGGSVKLGNDETTITVSGSHVDLDPSTTNVEPGASQGFTSTVKPEKDDSLGDVYYYRWENSAQYGHLSGGSDAFESTTVQSVTYQASADKEGVDTLSLSVYRERPGSERELLGMASAMVNVRKPYAVQLTPQGKKLAFGGSQVYAATVVPELGVGTELIYTWSNTATVGTLTGTGGTDHFEQSGNQATYRAGQTIGTDTLTVKVERISGGERFPMAEATATVQVARYIITVPATLALNWGSRPTITPTVTPSKPSGAYFKWTNTANKGTLTDNTAGHVDNFETTKASVTYTAKYDVADGPDTVRVELYTSDGVLQDSAETVITVSGPINVATALVMGSRKFERVESYDGCLWKYMNGLVLLTWSNPECSYDPDIEINTHGVDDNYLVTNHRIYSGYDGWQWLDSSDFPASTLCQPDNPYADPLKCQLVASGVRGITISGGGTSAPACQAWTPERADEVINERTAAMLDYWHSTYSTWGYRGTCWKKQKFN